jgi:hypothetical protein
MKDYSSAYINLQSLLKDYQKYVLKAQYNAAADAAVEMQLLSRDLQEWAEQCTETKNS